MGIEDQSEGSAWVGRDLDSEFRDEVAGEAATEIGTVTDGVLVVDIHGPRVHVEWDPASPVTSLGQWSSSACSWRWRACSAVESSGVEFGLR